MATTLNNLVDDVQLDLAGFTYRQDRVTYLTESIDATSLTLKVASTDNIGKGIIEIDDEMLWVDSYDRQSNTITIAPFGRGYNATTAAAHDVNAKITIAPTYPRQAVKRAINDTINSVYVHHTYHSWLAVQHTLYQQKPSRFFQWHGNQLDQQKNGSQSASGVGTLLHMQTHSLQERLYQFTTTYYQVVL